MGRKYKISQTDRRELIEDIIEWDVVNWWRAVQFWNGGQYRPDGDLAEKKVLDIGGRNGGLSLYWALKGAEVICSDISEAGFDRARELHRKYGVEAKIRYEIIDATKIPYEKYFDIVCFKSVLGGVGRNNNYERQKLMMENIHRSLTDNGYLFFAENLKGSAMHRILRRIFMRRKWRYISLSEISGLTELFSETEYRTFGFLGVLGRRKWLSDILGTADGRWDRYVKEQDRYIVSCICKK